MAKHQTLGQSARTSLLWGGGFHFIRDVAQFGVMLMMVRLLTPEDYGSAALAQSIVGLISVISFNSLVLHALQLRDPAEIDWQAHFSAATVVNAALFGLTLLLAWALAATERYGDAALPLAGLAVTFLIEIPGTLRHRMLETQHEWIRLRLLLIIGTLLGLGIGLTIALLGGGVWGLVVQPPLFGLPAAIDLFWHGRWRPNWTWSWSRYRDTLRFGITRMGSAAMTRGRQTVENTVLTNSYDFGGLGVFTRSIGLATLIAGRIGTLTMGALYAVVTRNEPGSSHFQRIAGLTLQGVSWTTIPAAAFLGFSAEDMVALLYGSQWAAVAPLLPLAVAGVALTGMSATLSSLLLANHQVKLGLVIDLIAAAFAIGLALWLVPIGVMVYLAALAGHALLVLLITITALVSTDGIARESLVPAFLPAFAATGCALASIVTLRFLGIESDWPALRIGLEAGVFCLVYLVVLRVAFAGALRALLQVAPGGARLMRVVRFT